jgi:hypothetical protein
MHCIEDLLELRLPRLYVKAGGSVQPRRERRQ